MMRSISASQCRCAFAAIPCKVKTASEAIAMTPRTAPRYTTVGLAKALMRLDNAGCRPSFQLPGLGTQADSCSFQDRIVAGRNLRLLVPPQRLYRSVRREAVKQAGAAGAVEVGLGATALWPAGC